MDHSYAKNTYKDMHHDHNYAGINELEDMEISGNEEVEGSDELKDRESSGIEEVGGVINAEKLAATEHTLDVSASEDMEGVLKTEQLEASTKEVIEGGVNLKRGLG